MEQGNTQPATVPTLSVLGHRSDATLGDIVKYAETLNWGTLCVTLDDEQGRFRIWASNLGALQPAESMKSLDRRLQDAPLMRKSVISGLERLEGSAKRALAILNKTAPNRSISGSHENPTTELDELLLSIRSAINHLFSLSMLMRRQRPRGRLPDFEEIALESSPDISYLTDKFPKAKSSLWLARRLGNNITRQRRMIQYRQHHRESLAKRDIKGSDPTYAATIVATTFQEEENASGTNQTPHDSDSSRVSIFTSATSFLSLEDGTATGRSIPDLSDMTLDGVQLDYGEPFECPYCRTIQNVRNRYEWKRHVFTDLQPYVCTFEDCVTSKTSFPTRAEWFQHEYTVHRLQWSCNWCSQPDIIFNSAEELKKHLNNTHVGMVTAVQMPLIIETCERPVRSFVSDSCPLCADWEPPSTKENAKSFSRHLARHLQQLALEALPLAIDGLEIRDASGLSDDESSLSRGSGNEEDVRNQPTNQPSILIQGEAGRVNLDTVAMINEHLRRVHLLGIDYPALSRTGSPPVVQEANSDSQSGSSGNATKEREVLAQEGAHDHSNALAESGEVTEESGLEQIKGKTPVSPEAAESSQIEEDVEDSEADVTESAVEGAYFTM
ncbi:hypothetical protein NW766_005965 [Fusarium irregulare]|uniref:C2H2-type domain-containing protein n=1 Tax=Fusarium irregulare TaxID=2494466 RepID=A0A9W8PQQ7_9HYPO|nr:hypothetical protein NW766_005965 [Fusarium irregulare]